MDENGGKAVIEDGVIVIRVPLDALSMVIEGWWASGLSGTRYRITDVSEFSADLVRTLNAESEDGTTRIHQMFDGAIEHAIDQGAFGIVEHEEQDA